MTKKELSSFFQGFKEFNVAERKSSSHVLQLSKSIKTHLMQNSRGFLTALYFPLLLYKFACRFTYCTKIRVKENGINAEWKLSIISERDNNNIFRVPLIFCLSFRLLTGNYFFHFLGTSLILGRLQST